MQKNDLWSEFLVGLAKWDWEKKFFKIWLAEQAEEIFGSQTNAAKAMEYEPKTLRNAKG